MKDLKQFCNETEIDFPELKCEIYSQAAGRTDGCLIWDGNELLMVVIDRKDGYYSFLGLDDPRYAEANCDPTTIWLRLEDWRCYKKTGNYNVLRGATAGMLHLLSKKD